MSDPILAVVGSNLRLLERVREALARQTPIALRNVQAALDAGDSQELYQAAHKLKGSVSNFPEAAAIEFAAALEAAATAGDLSRARVLVPQLSVALEDLMRRIDVAIAGSAPHP